MRDKGGELKKIQGNPEAVAEVLEIMHKSLAWSVKKGLEHGQNFQEIVTKFIARNI